MCHCAPVFRIHNTASKTRRVGIGSRPGRLSGTFSSGKCSRIRSHWSSRSFNTHIILRHYIDVRNDFEIGSNDIVIVALALNRARGVVAKSALRVSAVLVHERRCAGEQRPSLAAVSRMEHLSAWTDATVVVNEGV